jgi:hypothetical protein
MQRRPDEPELVGASEAAEILGVHQTNLRVVAGLPAPYDRIKATTLWRTKEVRALALERGRTEEEIAAVMERLHLELLTTRVRRNKPSTTTEETEKVA